MSRFEYFTWAWLLFFVAGYVLTASWPEGEGVDR